MIARLIRGLWLLTIAAALAVAAAAVALFGHRIGPWAAGLGGAMLVAAAHPLVIAFDFVWSRVCGDRPPPALRSSPWRALLTYDAEIDASLRGFWFATPFRAHGPAPRPPAGAPLRPFALLFIHGYLCNRAVWGSFMRAAAARGHVCEAITLDPFAAIDSHGDAVREAVGALHAAAREAGIAAPRVAIVAHSMGGLVARAALQTMEPGRVAHLVTLGTPHHGTVLARLGRAPSVAQMRRGSAWLAALDARERAGSGLSRADCTTLFSYHDEIVFPQRTATLDRAHEIAIGRCGHVSLLFDRGVRDAVFSRLDDVAESLDGSLAASSAPGQALGAAAW